jgi:hypothetical protein
MATNIANIICQAIEKVGSENVVVIINATMYKSVGQIIKDKYFDFIYNYYRIHGFILSLETYGKK